MFVGQINKVLLPLTVLLVVAMIIFPLPYQLLDILLAGNFAFCIILLLSSLFVSEPDRFTSLPTILLLSTLFRLGLNISSTRLILSGSYVPDMIVAFGQFVVAGSTIVGLVIFAIISVIQFVVISKGSERVAEVAARFTLDAMPGKQMSIDADMRAGLLSLSEAREKRRELHRESKLYGALDGAMKFIKGDAIVGLLIIVINISAGFLIGVIRDGVPILEAIDKYTLLTIGDGLVSQIPAVLVSIAAGIVITRVNESEGSVLSDEIGSQLSNEPFVLLFGGLVIAVLSTLPGLPFFSLIISAIVALTFWYIKYKKKLAKDNLPEDYPFNPRILPPLVIRLSSKGAQLLQSENRIINYYDALRSLAFEDLGVVLPDLCFDIDPLESKITGEIVINGQQIQKIEFYPVHDVLGCKDGWSRYIGAALQEKIYFDILKFLTDAHTRRLLDIYEQRNFESIKSLTPDKISITGLTLLLRCLAEEGISIRNFASILDSLNEFFEENLNRNDMLSHVRKRLIRSYLLKNLGGLKELNVYVLDSELEHQIITPIYAGLPLHPEISQRVRNLVKFQLTKGSNNHDNDLFWILVPSKIRRSIFQLLGLSSREVVVLGCDEIPEDFLINPVVLEIEEEGEALCEAA